MRLQFFPKGLFGRQGVNLSFKIFIVCISISLFLTIIIGIFTQSYIMNRFDYEIEKFEKGQVNKTSNSIVMLLEEFEKTGQSYAMNPVVTQFIYLSERDLSSRYTEVQKIQYLLSNTINSSSYISNIFLYYEKSGMIFDFSAPLEYTIFYDSSWKEYYDNLTGNSGILDTHKIKSDNFDFRTGSYKNDNITFITRLPFDHDKKLGAVIINVNQSIISDVLKNITVDSDSLAFLTNSDGVVLSSNIDNYLYKNISSITGFPFKSTEQGSEKIEFTFNGHKTICYFADMPINNWKLFIMIPENIMFKKSLEIRLVSALILICLLLLMVVVSLFATRKLYKPITTITAALKSIINSNESSNSNNRNINDILIINNGLNVLFENNKNLEKVISENRVLFREYFLSNLITGRFRKKELIVSKADYFQVNLDFTCFCVVAVKNKDIAQNSLEAEKLELKKLALIDITQRAFKNEGIDIICSQDSNDNILLFIKMYEEYDEDKFRPLINRCLHNIKKDISCHVGIPVILGIGKIYCDILDVGLSYKEALRALQYCFIEGDIADAAKISRSEKNGLLYYPLDMEKNIIFLAGICDYDKVMLCINKGIEEIISRNRNIDHILKCLTNIINLVIRCVCEFDLNLKNIVGKEDSSKISIMDFNDINEFKEWIGKVFQKIIDNNTSMHKEEDLSISSKFREYVEDNYMKDISLSLAAEHFGYNSSYFSRLFKESIGTNFFDYVSRVRIEKSKVLLSTTNSGIQKIAGQVGYNNRSSFIRTFIRHTSTTPSEYRQKSGKS